MKVWLLAIEALDENDSPITLRFSSGQYDDPDGNYWDNRLKQPALYRAGMYTGQYIQVDRSGYGEIVLINNDGGLNYLVDYAFDGRPCLSIVYDTETETLDDVFFATTSRVGFTNTDISIILRDPVEVFREDHPRTYYLGDNVLPDGLEGVEDDIKGLPKPRVYGAVSNGSPVLVNSSKLIYQISDRDVTITHAYDRGFPLTRESDYTSLAQLESTEPSAGSFKCFEGYVRLGSMSMGQVTVDAECVEQGVGSVLQSVLIDLGYLLTSAVINTLNAKGNIRLFLSTSEVSTENLINTIIDSVCGYWRVTKEGDIDAGTIILPKTTPDYQIYDWQILRIDRTSIGSGTNGVPIKAVEILADRIHTVQTDLASAIMSGEDDITLIYGGSPNSTYDVITNTDRIARLSEEYRNVIVDCPTCANRHLLAETLTIASQLSSLNDAENIATELLSAVKVRRDTVNVTVRFSELVNIAVGDTVEIFTDRIGYNNGRLMVVIGLTLDASSNEYEIRLWG